jgi:hypothetical protein
MSSYDKTLRGFVDELIELREILSGSSISIPPNYVVEGDTLFYDSRLKPNKCFRVSNIRVKIAKIKPAEIVPDAWLQCMPVLLEAVGENIPEAQSIQSVALHAHSYHETKDNGISITFAYTNSVDAFARITEMPYDKTEKLYTVIKNYVDNERIDIHVGLQMACALIRSLGKEKIITVRT